MAEKRKADDELASPAKRAKGGEFRTNPDFIVTLTETPAIRLAAAGKKDNVVFVAERTDKLPDVFKGLVKHGFLSCPVLQKTHNKYYGFIDVADIVKFAIAEFGHTETPVEDLAKVEAWANATVNDVMKFPLTKRNPFHPFQRDYSLFSVMEALAREPSLHRVPLIDADRNLKNVLTQSQVASYLKDNIAALGDRANMPLSRVPGAIGDVISVNENKTAMDAFNIMLDNNISGLAVVGDDGKLVGNLSLRDLKAIMTDARMFWRLKMTVHNFLRHLREDCAQRDGRPRTKVTLHDSDTLGTAITKLADNHVHRVFIVDAAGAPTGVISLKDVISTIIL